MGLNNAKPRLYTAINPPILYPGESDLMVHLRKCSVIFSRMYFVPVVLRHQVTKSAQLIAVCKRTLR